MAYKTSISFQKNPTVNRDPYELCYEYRSISLSPSLTQESKWVRYCVFNTVNKTVTMERCEGKFFDGYENIELDQASINFIVSIAPDTISLSHDERGWS